MTGIGVLFLLLGNFGILRLPDVYNRNRHHAARMVLEMSADSSLCAGDQSHFKSRHCPRVKEKRCPLMRQKRGGPERGI